MADALEDYALLGDCESAALVSRRGSIDWLCWPRFDSGACFAALLGAPAHGRWLIAPVEPKPRISRAYTDGTLVLHTEFETDTGAVTLIDFMPAREGVPHLVRLVVGRRGTVAMQMELILRFDYGESVPWVSKLEGENGVQAIAGPDRVVLRTPVALRGEARTTVAEFEIAAGETVPFVLSHAPSHAELPPALDAAAALREAEAGWQKWSARSQYRGDYTDAVQRSLITLKALTYRPTGGIVAAPTTSLPEQLGGVRNWDYRYCWLRDATLTLLALMNAGYFDEAAAWRGWLERAVAGAPEQIRIMYGLAGERRLPESELDTLPGYQGAKPVRVGNAAAQQLQLDVYGEMMDALHQARIGGLDTDATAWSLQCALTGHLETLWQQPDEGIWETRGGRKHFTYSKVMAWVAVDRAIKAIEDGGLEGPLARWRALRERIHAEVCTRGFDAGRNSFVQSYGAEVLDASLLQIAITGFLPADDPRVLGTVAAIERELLVDGFVRRYRTEQADDGLPPREGAFLACSFWLADNYILQGRLDEARALFERLLAIRNDLGLLAEEYDPRAGRLVGNFPQAFSHVALVNTAFNLGRSGPAQQRPDGDGRRPQMRDRKPG